MDRNGPMSAIVKKTMATRTKLVESKDQLKTIIFKIDECRNIDTFPEWLQRIFKDENNNLKAVVVRPEKEDVYLRSIDDMRVCVFNHSVENDDFIKVESPFYDGFRNHFSEISHQDQRRKIESLEALADTLDENGELDPY